MGAPGLTSPIRAQGFENLQLNAGVIIPNFSLDNIYDKGSLQAAVASKITTGKTLGMTSGGGTFTISRETRLPDVDGRRYLHKGAQFVDSMDGNLTSTLIEITPENWQYVIGTTKPLASNTATKKAYKIKTMLDDDAYINNIVWVGDLADGRFTAIEFYNALNTADITFTFADKNEGKLPFELHAHQDNVLAYDVAPVRVHFFADYGMIGNAYAPRSMRTETLNMRPAHGTSYVFTDEAQERTNGDTTNTYHLTFDYKLEWAGQGNFPYFSDTGNVSVSLVHNGGTTQIGNIDIAIENMDKRRFAADIKLTAAQASDATRRSITFSGTGLPTGGWQFVVSDVMLQNKNLFIENGFSTQLTIPAGGVATVISFVPPLDEFAHGKEAAFYSDYVFGMKLEPAAQASVVRVGFYETADGSQNHYSIAYANFGNEDSEGRKFYTVPAENGYGVSRPLAMVKIKNTGAESVQVSLLDLHYSALQEYYVPVPIPQI